MPGARVSAHSGVMPALLILVIIVGIVLLFFGLLVEAVRFLLFIGAAVLIIGVIAWLMRSIRNKT